MASTPDQQNIPSGRNDSSPPREGVTSSLKGAVRCLIPAAVACHQLSLTLSGQMKSIFSLEKEEIRASLVVEVSISRSSDKSRGVRQIEEHYRRSASKRSFQSALIVRFTTNISVKSRQLSGNKSRNWGTSDCLLACEETARKRCGVSYHYLFTTTVVLKFVLATLNPSRRSIFRPGNILNLHQY